MKQQNVKKEPYFKKAKLLKLRRTFITIYKNQIVFYESFRNSNEYSAIISNDKLSQYKDTNQTLPDLYHQIILLFTDLKDQENYKKYSLESLKLILIFHCRLLHVLKFFSYFDY